MTDASKPAPTEEERVARAREKARLRKQRYDARMKGAASEEESGGRKACVLYLNEDARDVLKRNRLARRLLDQKPILDSELVEALLLAYRQQEEARQPVVTVKLHDFEGTYRLDKLVSRYNDLFEEFNDQLRELNAEKDSRAEAEAAVEEAMDDRDMDWSEAENALLPIHQREMAVNGARLVADIRGILNQANSDAEASRKLTFALADYIFNLIDQVQR